MTKETARMIRFIDNLSLIAQMMAGPAEKVIPVAHCEMVQDMYNYFESFLTEEGVSVEIDYSDGGAYVLANSRLLCRAIQNILANIPRSKAGENRVSIQVERDGLWARIKLNEPGFYIKKDDLAVLFEPFENGKIDLDLVVVRSIINHHQGFISARLVDGLVYFDFWIPPYLKETEQSVIKPEFVALNIV
ncbi:MAG: HAMP domain-containing histidine kinase [Anaerolineales bacterium]|nr:HAMP domain-containing histidine kinase [Anaerolineales bacterium]